MSISTLTEDKVDRNAQRAAPPPAAAAPTQAAPTQAAGGTPEQAGGVVQAAQCAPDDAKKTISDAISAVGAYVPTEIIAAYTIVLALGASDDLHHGGIPFSWFFGMFAFTPVFVWLVYAVRSKEENRDFLSPRLWPWWEAIAACIAFTVWSAALPDSAFVRCDWYSPRLAALALMLVSGLLPLIGSLVTNRRKPA